MLLSTYWLSYAEKLQANLHLIQELFLEITNSAKAAPNIFSLIFKTKKLSLKLTFVWSKYKL